MAKFRIEVDGVEKIIPLGPALEVPLGPDPDIVIRLNLGLRFGDPPGTEPMHCASCDRDYSAPDLERQITGHFAQVFARYRVDADLADAMHDALKPWIERIQAGTLICFECVVTPNAGPQ